jgi:4-cresol dehydrogenase (hydroxylating)
LQPHRPEGYARIDEGGCGVIWVGPILPFEGKTIDLFFKEAQIVFLRNQFDFFAEVMPTGPRAVVVLMGIFYDKSKEEECHRALKWFHEFHDLCMQSGYPPYRETLLGLDQLYQDNPEFLKTVQSIKSALDPNHILSRGRSGKEML